MAAEAKLATLARYRGFEGHAFADLRVCDTRAGGHYHARRFVAASPFAALLDPACVAALEDLLLRVGTLVDEVPEIVGLELNPVLVSPGTAAIVDAVVKAAPVDRDPLPPVRRL